MEICSYKEVIKNFGPWNFSPSPKLGETFPPMGLGKGGEDIKDGIRVEGMGKRVKRTGKRIESANWIK